ncbi:hypothetical protein DEA8626_03875 [Defluviimonas aquaemixtae]|uniref:ABM domain-containing protein n=1 Tax=Albidovulum aquaemixtae TaxID=1542388 RepID=A0A2R8BN97_9RHOB|nr:hypothetical protein [Defluviimonas aquaemixtae]SPH24842.1 hypothetical protein DEA8626_03875 [Defluviimonas aquaemixtae]
MQLLCRNDIDDYETWKDVFDADREAHGQAGLSLLQLWREDGEPNRVWFLFEVNDHAKAQAFLDAPQSEMHAKRAGVRDGDYHFLRTA